jgi:hypothetical protein
MTQEPPKNDDSRAGLPKFQPALAAGVLAAIILAIAIAAYWAQY